MATRGKTTFQKRQKEMARKDKQQRKAERRAQRKLDNSDSFRSAIQGDEATAELDTGTEPGEIGTVNEPV